MDKTSLHKIFKKSYNHQDWVDILQSVFGAKKLYVQPKSILLPDHERVSEAFELGSFTTTDDRIIGLYRIDVKPNVWLERNKVGLRELLRNVYKYDVDGAIVVFVQDEQWRLSFISEIKVLNEVGEIVKQATEPKRYTYLLGKDEKIRTPAERLSKLVGKDISLQDILNAFSVEALNEEFYKIVQTFFYELVGGKVGKGKKATDYEKGILELPNANQSVRQEFAVRLIGRTVFCWFLKMKKSANGIALLPEILLSSKAVKNYNNYYHSILEFLFFQILNTPIDERMSSLPKGAEIIPFLNGGLFEPNKEDYYKSDSKGYNQYNFGISDNWFLKFFEKLEKYNFTIDENSVTEIEVSVDPEMLGRIFENLLAEIDPDSGETARKATGSFYTPREIVDYMATESLVQYLHNQTHIEQDKLRPIFKMLEIADPEFTETEKNNILDALDQVKILDPACGSGAFPMGVLQKIVQALQKLDPKSEWWKKRQVTKISNAIVRKQLKEKLEVSGIEYARKIGVIQNSLYGVDIQPVAAEISKLRCFLSLIVDENIDETKPNRGIEPLPNLEFKFVTADTLINLPEEKQRNMFDNFEELQQLEDLRNEYIQSSGKAKIRVKEQFLKVQQKIANDQSTLFADINSKAYKLGNWNPFGNEKSDWFDPKLMFGIEKFNILIGNPPYVSHDKISNLGTLKRSYKVYEPFADLYCYFIEKGINLLTENGILNFITSNSFLRTNYGKPLRSFVSEEVNILELINVEDSQLFGNATVNTAILCVTSRKNAVLATVVNATFDLKSNFDQFVADNSFKYLQAEFKKVSSWTLLTPEKLLLLNKIYSNRPTLEDLKTKIRLGLATGSNEAFLINTEVENDLIKSDPRSADLIKPILRGRDISKYGYKLPPLKIILTKNGIDVSKYQSIYEHLDSFGENFKNRGAKGQHWTNLRACAFFDDFKLEKIVWIELSDMGRFAICRDEVYLLNSAYFLIPPKDHSSEFITAILNSRVIHFVLHSIAESSGTGTARWINNNVKEFPIPFINQQYAFICLVHYVEYLNKTMNNIEDFVPNTHLVQLFEEVIDAMVMELYFKEDFEKVGIEFIKYAERDFKSIKEIEEHNQIEIIRDAYQKLREKDNEIRNNLKLMDIKLADIVMPIKTAR